MTKTWFAVSALALSLGVTSGGLAAKANASPLPAQAGYGQAEWYRPGVALCGQRSTNGNLHHASRRHVRI